MYYLEKRVLKSGRGRRAPERQWHEKNEVGHRCLRRWRKTPQAKE